MRNKARHTIHGAHHHFGWDHAIPPVLTVAPGTTVEFECIDASGGQISAKSTLKDVAALDFAKVNPVTGPIFVDGAKAGDALKVTIHEFKPSGFGWTANIPGFGLLADQFADPSLHIWSYDKSGKTPAAFSPKGRVPLKPFAGGPFRRSTAPRWRQSRHPRSFRWNCPLPSDRGAGGYLFGRRHPCCPGGWRDLRDGDRKPDERGALLRP